MNILIKAILITIFLMAASGVQANWKVEKSIVNGLETTAMYNNATGVTDKSLISEQPLLSIWCNANNEVSALISINAPIGKPGTYKHVSVEVLTTSFPYTWEILPDGTGLILKGSRGMANAFMVNMLATGVIIFNVELTSGVIIGVQFKTKGLEQKLDNFGACYK